MTKTPEVEVEGRSAKPARLIGHPFEIELGDSVDKSNNGGKNPDSCRSCRAASVSKRYHLIEGSSTNLLHE